MSIRIVSDSSSNVYSLSETEFSSVPLKIRTAKKEYVDTPAIDVEKMVDEIKETKGKSSTSCPNIGDWLSAFDEAEEVFAVTITSRLSGSYASALEAAKIYEEAHPGSKVFVIDSLSAGPELRLIIERIEKLIIEGKNFEEIKENVTEYQNHTHLVFSLQSLINFARNGRVNPAVAKVAGVLGIRIMGAAKEGVLDPLHKCRGEAKSISTIFEEMKKFGFKGGKVRIAHCFNIESADILKNMILSEFPKSDIKIEQNGALCSYYAERGGVLVGFEG